MNALVIGGGSIGIRHFNLLKKMGHNLAIVTQRQDLPGLKVFRELPMALKQWQPDYVVVASRTAEHYENLVTWQENVGGQVLVERPVLAEPARLPFPKKENWFVGYNLRFHPCIQELKKQLANQKILSAQFYVGQYLPSWRPHADYTKGYSAHKKEGGGALRDLSHEIDLATWLLGKAKFAHGIVGKFSSLQIDSDDTCGILMALERCPVVTMQMNYTDRLTQRKVTVTTDSDTFAIDLIAGEFKSSHDSRILKPSSSDETYEKMHLSILGNESTDVCTFEDGLKVVDLINVIEEAP